MTHGKFINPFTDYGKLANVADIDKLDEPMRSQYEHDLKVYRDNLYVWEGAKAEGRKEGRREGRKEGRKEGKGEGMKEKSYDVASKMLKDNMPLDLIAKYTGLSAEAIENIKRTQ